MESRPRGGGGIRDSISEKKRCEEGLSDELGLELRGEREYIGGREVCNLLKKWGGQTGGKRIGG
jgi:hypothetical protein